MACGWQPWLQSLQQVQRVLPVQLHLVWQCQVHGTLLSAGEAAAAAAAVGVAASAVGVAEQMRMVARQNVTLDGAHAAQSVARMLVSTALEPVVLYCRSAVVQCCMCAVVQCCVPAVVQCCVPAVVQCCMYVAVQCCTYVAVQCYVYAVPVSAAIGTKTHTYNSVNITEYKS